ncbi:DUF924-domain-containing protein [Coccomyxa subellipsoidea C-169]|uniref:DUF924-domain-containing protein n=1 Tax=Coccomyxa subellipsoidea (strain C-169) TaxID=574566 RepID=I0YKY1_COCSC|nr:DUF924-domain-containing protein [Coccomyxa subellipsoidea C-169]EIE19050.1 DUF924-domain-containing protein [Coccomyxa subellipsoidea C-169]|eukprot:XP_005643594.1 DUF924-domain-containing protein [Coccomyxa subellipsoidea C-169]
MDPKAQAVLEYWLGEDYRSHSPHFQDKERVKLWFGGGEAVDKEVKERFGAIVEEATSGGLRHWKRGYEALAGVILRDQFTRNVFRGTPRMFSLDQEALSLAKSLVESGEAGQIIPPHRVWLYMAYMHSEVLQDQQDCVRLFQELEAECRRLPGGGEPMASRAADNARFAIAHESVISKWGRFPHRNAVLGRQSTAEEAAGLQDGSIPRF